MGYGGRGKPQKFDNEMRGALFDGDPQKDSDPDFRGQVQVDGVEYWIAAWWKKSKKVGDFISFALTPKDERGSQQQDRRGPPHGRGPSSEPRGRGGPPARRDDPQERRSDRGRNDDEMDDDIPFN